MSFLNSVINQVGREVGRDLYNSAKSSIKSNKHIVSNTSILNNIKSFQVSPYDKVTLRNLNILYNNIEQVNSNSFDWVECHIAFDELIESLEIDKKYQNDIDILDKKNSDRYLLNKELHKTFVNKLIDDYQEKVNFYNNRNGFLTLFLTLIGVSALYTCKSKFKYLICIYDLPIFGLYLALYNCKIDPSGYSMFLALLFPIYRAFSHRRTNLKNTKTLLDLKEYSEKLMIN